MSKSVSLVVTLLALIAFGSLASAQTIDTSCATTLSGGSGNFSYTYCVSQHGNVVQMDTPTTPTVFQHLLATHLSEGFGLCDVTGGNTEYFDYGDGGLSTPHFWREPVLLNTSPLTIGRKSDDGIWELRQTFTKSDADSSIKIRMDILNQTAIKREAKLVRFADVKVNGGATGNGVTDLFQATLLSASVSDFIKTTPQSPGMQLRDAGHGTPTPYVQKVQTGPAPCSATANVNPNKPFLVTPGSLELVYGDNIPITVPANGVKTATVLYRPF